LRNFNGASVTTAALVPVVEVIGVVEVVFVRLVFGAVEVVLATVFVWALTDPPRQAVNSANAKAGFLRKKVKFISVVFSGS
jgi:hypothetical protein